MDIQVRVYEELNRYLPAGKRRATVEDRSLVTPLLRCNVAPQGAPRPIRGSANPRLPKICGRRRAPRYAA